MTLLTAAAVLLWPGVRPLRLLPVRATGPEAGAGLARTVVPVAEVAGVIDLLALMLRGGVGLVEAMETVAMRVGGPLGT